MQFTKGTASLFLLVMLPVPPYVLLEIWKRSPSAGARVLTVWGLVVAAAVLVAPAVSWMVKLEAFALAVGSFVLLLTLLAIGPRWLGRFLNRRRD